MDVVPSSFVKAKFRKARIPARRKRDVKRKLADSLYHMFLSALVDGDAKWLVVHGMPGCGKTSLVSELLWSYPDIEGHHFKRIIWLTDRNSDPKEVRDIATDALALLNPEAILQNDAPLPDAALRMRLETELECGEPCLVVLDEVLLEKTVRYFDDLKCSVIATTTNREIFSLLEKENVAFFRVSCDDVHLPSEIGQLVGSFGICSSLLETLMSVTGNNLALIEKACQLATRGTNGDKQEHMLKLLCQWIANEPLRKVSCTTAYQHPDMEAAMRQCCALVDCDLLNKFENFSVFKPNTWTPLEIISLVWPVDVGGYGSKEFEKVEVVANLGQFEERSLLECTNAPFLQSGTGIIEESDSPGISYKVHPIVHSYVVHSLVTDKALIGNLAELLLHRLSAAKQSLQASDTFALPSDESNAELFVRFYEANAAHFREQRRRYGTTNGRVAQANGRSSPWKGFVSVSIENIQFSAKVILATTLIIVLPAYLYRKL